jgi:hypothetical protein
MLGLTTTTVRATVAALLLIGFTAACGPVDVVDEPALPPSPEPAPAPTGPTDEVPAELPTLPVHFVRSGPASFYVEPVDVDATAALAGTDPASLSAEELARVLFTLQLGTTPTDPDLSTSVPRGVELLGVSISDSVLTIDVSGALASASGSSSQETTLAEQLAHTATNVPGVSALALTVDGAPVSELWGHLDWSRPIEPDPFSLSPITIVGPAHGETVSAGTVVVTGLATVFEATLLVRLLDANGAVVPVEPGFVTASEGGPGRGDWTWEIELAPGTWTIEAEAPDMSDGEGPPPFVTRRTVVVVAG